MLEDRLLDGRLKLRHLTMVTTIADQGSLVGAARALHVTQPVVTRGLHEVEEILGVRLFDRGRRGVVPTVFGESFTHHARGVLAQLRQAGGQIDLLLRADIGRVTVGTHLAGSNMLLPNAIIELKREHPLLTVVVREATPEALSNALLAGEIDLSVGRLTADPPFGVTQERLHLEPVRLVARRDHPVHRMARPRLRDLVAHPWVFPIEETALRAELEEVFAREGVDLPANRVECTSILTLRQLLVSGDAIAALPELIADRDPDLAVVAIRLPSISRSVGVSTAADRPMLPAAHELLSHLRQAARRLATGG